MTRRSVCGTCAVSAGAASIAGSEKGAAKTKVRYDAAGGAHREEMLIFVRVGDMCVCVCGCLGRARSSARRCRVRRRGIEYALHWTTG